MLSPESVGEGREREILKKRVYEQISASDRGPCAIQRE